jgi:hypothetical protein
MKIISRKQARRILEKDDNRVLKPGKKYRWQESLHRTMDNKSWPCLRRFSTRSRKRNQLLLIHG